ncbi:MAG: FlgD immunoglobulin-like domain containing protein [bacterium]
MPRRSKRPAHTTLKIYNILGQEVRALVDEHKGPGYYEVTWDGRNEKGDEVSSGVYSYRLSVNGARWSETRKMVLLR